MKNKSSSSAHLVFLTLITLGILVSCGGDGGSAAQDPNADGSAAEALNADDDNDGVINSLDVDDDNDGLIEIANLEQLDWMRNDLNGSSQKDNNGNVLVDGCPAVTGCNGYELVANLDFDTNADGVMDASDTYFDYDGDNQNNGWLPVGNSAEPFMATFEGNNYRIRNLFINRDSSDTETHNGSRIGLFGFINGIAKLGSGIEIRNLLLDGALMQVTGVDHVGGLVGFASFVKISNLNVSGAVTGPINVGGLAGKATSFVTLSNSTASGAVTGNSNIGGLVGFAADDININNSSASGAVAGSTYTGGLVGFTRFTVDISNSSASGTVSGIIYTGGLVGLARASITIMNSFATGAVIGSGFTGGLVGSINFIKTPTTDVCNISNSFATGTVNGSGDNVGGLIGLAYYLNLNDSFATGAVSNGYQYIGGLVGNANTGTQIGNSFAANTVAGSSSFGALVGYSDDAIYTNNYFANEQGLDALGTNNISAGALNPVGTNGAPLATLQATTSAGSNSQFINWGSIWDFGSNSLLPGLIINGIIYRDGDANGVLD